jgi:hypothetical protein
MLDLQLESEIMKERKRLGLPDLTQPVALPATEKQDEQAAEKQPEALAKAVIMDRMGKALNEELEQSHKDTAK